MIPRLPRGVRLHRCSVRDSDVLLGPERALMLDPVAHAILSRVDGAASEAEIVADLCVAFGAPAAQVGRDVSAFLADLAEKRLVDLDG